MFTTLRFGSTDLPSILTPTCCSLTSDRNRDRNGSRSSGDILIGEGHGQVGPTMSSTAPSDAAQRAPEPPEGAVRRDLLQRLWCDATSEPQSRTASFRHSRVGRTINQRDEGREVANDQIQLSSLPRNRRLEDDLAFEPTGACIADVTERPDISSSEIIYQPRPQPKGDSLVVRRAPARHSVFPIKISPMHAARSIVAAK